MQDTKYKEVFLDFKKQSYQFEVMKVKKSALTMAIEQQVDIVEVASRYADIKKVGTNYMANCVLPSHTDKTPSMIVNPRTQRFRCFGCGYHGNVIQLVADAEGMKYMEARAKLKSDYGIKGFDHIKSEPSPFNYESKQAILNYVVHAFNYTLTSSAPKAIKCMAFLNKHGINQEQIDTYKIGLAPPDDEALVQALVANEHDIEMALEIGVINKVNDTYRSNITSSITMAKIHYGQLTGIDVFKADEIGKLKIQIQNKKAKQISETARKKVRSI